MIISEFQAWIAGLRENMGNIPTAKTWQRILDEIELLSAPAPEPQQPIGEGVWDNKRQVVAVMTNAGVVYVGMDGSIRDQNWTLFKPGELSYIEKQILKACEPSQSPYNQGVQGLQSQAVGAHTVGAHTVGTHTVNLKDASIMDERKWSDIFGSANNANVASTTGRW